MKPLKTICKILTTIGKTCTFKKTGGKVSTITLDHKSIGSLNLTQQVNGLDNICSIHHIYSFLSPTSISNFARVLLAIHNHQNATSALMTGQNLMKSSSLSLIATIRMIY